jgi:hypothetical protein
MPEILFVDDHLLIVTGLKTGINSFLAYCKTHTVSGNDASLIEIKTPIDYGQSISDTSGK